MTVETPIPEAESHTEPTESPEGVETPEGGNEDRPMPREQRYRMELRAAEAERDSLASRVADLQTRELHRLAGEHLAAPEDIAMSGKSLADFLTPEGWVDHEAVAEAAAAVIESRPGLAKNQRAVDLSQGTGNGRPGKGQPSLADVFRV